MRGPGLSLLLFLKLVILVHSSDQLQLSDDECPPTQEVVVVLERLQIQLPSILIEVLREFSLRSNHELYAES